MTIFISSKRNLTWRGEMGRQLHGIIQLSILVAILVALAIESNPASAGVIAGYQWNHHKEEDGEIVCRMHGVEEVEGEESHPCSLEGGEMFTSSQAYCVSNPHNSGDYGFGYVPGGLHSEEQGCSGSGGT